MSSECLTLRQDGDNSSQQNEDTMSQVSVNTDDMTDDPVKKATTAGQDSSAHDESDFDLDRSQRYRC